MKLLRTELESLPAPSISTPKPELPEMKLRSLAVVPPMMLDLAPLPTRTPAFALGTLLDLDASSPMTFPTIAFPVAETPSIETPLRLLPEMTFA